MTSTSEQQTASLDGQWQRFAGWGRRVGLAGKLSLFLAVAAMLAIAATYALWTGTGPLPRSPHTVLAMLVVDLGLLLALGALLAPQFVQLWVQRRSGSASSRLHTRFVALFALLAGVPAIVTAIFSAVFFNYGVESWFSDRVSTAVRESLAVAEAYVEEHRNAMRADVLAMANDLNREASRLIRTPQLAPRILQTQAILRSLNEATLFTSTGHVIARYSYAYSVTSEMDTVPPEALERASRGEVVIFRQDNDDDVQALIRLVAFVDTYLFVGRYVDPRVLGHVERARAVVRDYEVLEGSRFEVQLASALMFTAMALLLMLVAIWLGLMFANRLVRPIAGLVQAAERVRQGDLAARVAEGAGDDEIGALARAFNRMTSQLQAQRGELVEANRQLDKRRRFTEAVLSGVSAGVIGLDRDGKVHLPNRSAAALLECDADSLTGRRLAEAVPELAPLLEQAAARGEGLTEGQITLTRNGRRRYLLARVASEPGLGERQGFVVTFDDITALMQAQRTAAWSDVARRIAHEIKNPLTPIQLAAERLKRKYLKEVQTDPHVFTQCTDTIMRQVGDIGRMVDEFSAFARMPSPVMKNEDLRIILRQAVFDQQLAHPEVTYVERLPEGPVTLQGDGRQLAQVFMNVLKNASESLEATMQSPPCEGWRGRIEVTAERQADRLVVRIADNGRGFPPELRERLTEPYVTTRAKGTGLGLAIVRKIVEDHGGRIDLEDAEGGGALVCLTLPATAAAELTEREGRTRREVAASGA